MRTATFIAPAGLRLPVSADPRDVLDHGEQPRHRLAGPVIRQDGARLILRGDPGDPILVRLPRRLARMTTEDARRWISGEAPEPHALLLSTIERIEPPPRGPPLGPHAEAYERRYEGQGVGFAKPLPRRRRRASPEERSALFQHISDSLHQLGVDAADALNRTARERLLGARAVVEQAVERSAPGSRVTGYEVTDDGDVRVQILAPIKEIQFRMVVSSDVVRLTES